MPDSFVPPIVLVAQKASLGKPAPNLLDWWRALCDPELDSLIGRAIEPIPDLETALTRLQAARTQERAVTGRSLPACRLR
ncbi:MAG: hypothetical protein J2P49_04675 [Methylocapsa sp.]|nr:hypothetical protein [Methylocapsa sp.]